MLIPLFWAYIFDRIFVILAGKEDSHKSLDEFKFRQIHSRTAELAVLERLKNLHRLTTISGRNVVTTLAPPILMDLL